VAIGLFAGLDRPGDNVTDVTNLNLEIGPKRLELLHELLPSLTTAGILVNASNQVLSDPFGKGIEVAAGRLGIKVHIVNASTERDLDSVFTALAEQQLGGIVVGPDIFLSAYAE
jgi:putative ABC transport system substrate-binding protein